MPTLRLDLGRIATVTLARPDRRNALTLEMAGELAEAVQRIDADPAVRVVLVRGEGHSFCAGGDFDLIEAASTRPVEENRLAMRRFYGAMLVVARIRVPTIAVVQGAAVGAGLCLAAACDLRVAAEDAKLGANFVRIGLHPGMAATALLPRLVGAARATELLLTGRTVSGVEAAAMGLVHQAVPTADLAATATALAETIAAAAPIAVRQAKETLQRTLWPALEEATDRESFAQALDFATEDLREAVRAFREGRAPDFSGR